MFASLIVKSSLNLRAAFLSQVPRPVKSLDKNVDASTSDKLFDQAILFDLSAPGPEHLYSP